MRLQADVRVVFKALCKLQQEGLAIAAPVVATDAAVGTKACPGTVQACLMQIVADTLVATGRWQQCSACKAEAVHAECEDLPPAQEAGVCLVRAAAADPGAVMRLPGVKCPRRRCLHSRVPSRTLHPPRMSLLCAFDR